MVTQAPVASTSRRGAVLVVLVVLVVLAAATLLTGCVGGDDDDAGDVDANGPEATLAAPETLPPQQVDATIPGGTGAGTESAALAEILADGAVTAEELASAYDTYISCLAEGGGAGRYAYDVELRTRLVVEWADDDSGDIDRNALSADCSRRFLGDVTRRFEQANPPSDDLVARQRTSIARCIEPISPQAAANLPEQISLGTAGEASSLSELQLDPAALDPATLGSSVEDLAGVSSCIAAVGAKWQPFG